MAHPHPLLMQDRQQVTSWPWATGMGSCPPACASSRSCTSAACSADDSGLMPRTPSASALILPIACPIYPPGAAANGAERGRAGVRVPAAAAFYGGDQAAAAALRAPILAVHDRSYSSGRPPGDLHPIGADHCPERQRSRAWSGRVSRTFKMLWPCRGSTGAGCAPVEGPGKRILKPLTAAVEG